MKSEKDPNSSTPCLNNGCFTLANRGFANAGSKSEGENDRTNCN